MRWACWDGRRGRETAWASQAERESQESLRKHAVGWRLQFLECMGNLGRGGGGAGRRNWKGSRRPKWVPKQEFSLRVDKSQGVLPGLILSFIQQIRTQAGAPEAPPWVGSHCPPEANRGSARLHAVPWEPPTPGSRGRGGCGLVQGEVQGPELGGRQGEVTSWVRALGRVSHERDPLSQVLQLMIWGRGIPSMTGTEGQKNG